LQYFTANAKNPRQANTLSGWKKMWTLQKVSPSSWRAIAKAAIVLVVSLKTLAAACATPPEIVARCEEEWGTDYVMQVWCQDKQTKALRELQKNTDQNKIEEKEPPLPKNAGRTVIWDASTTTSISITGNIRLSDSVLDFVNGEQIKLKLISSSRSKLKKMFSVVNGANPILLNTNKFCGVDELLSYLIAEISKSHREMTLSIYCNKSNPPVSDFRSSGDLYDEKHSFDGTYGYSLADDQANWSPSINVESHQLDGMIETFCADKAPYDVSPEKWRNCIKSETNAIGDISAMLEKLPKAETESLLSDCAGYVTGLRGLGSQEYVSRQPIARCVRMTTRAPQFSKCVKNVTGKPYQNDIFWRFEAAQKIADCFNEEASRFKG
jgi:hypothetical protein